MMALQLLLLPAGALAAGQQDDWLLAAPTAAATVVPGTLAGVPTLTLTNGLSSRTFAVIAPDAPPPGPPPAPPAPCPKSCTGCQGGKVCCDNPGGKLHHGPNPGEVYASPQATLPFGPL